MYNSHFHIRELFFFNSGTTKAILLMQFYSRLQNLVASAFQRTFFIKDLICVHVQIYHSQEQSVRFYRPVTMRKNRIETIFSSI